MDHFKKYKSRSRHPKTVLQGYRMYLMGSSDADIEGEGAKASEIQKFKKFHTDMVSGKAFYSSGQALGIERNIAKRMLHLFEQWQAGMPLSCNSRTEYPRLKFCFSLFLDGVSDIELHEKFTPVVVKKVKEFMKYPNSNMLSSTIATEAKIPRSTVKTLLKIYREKQAADKLSSNVQHIECIAISTR